MCGENNEALIELAPFNANDALDDNAWPKDADYEKLLDQHVYKDPENNKVILDYSFLKSEEHAIDLVATLIEQDSKLILHPLISTFIGVKSKMFS